MGGGDQVGGTRDVTGEAKRNAGAVEIGGGGGCSKGGGAR